MDQEEKEQYYSYTRSGPVYKQPPVLDSGITDAIERVGKDEFGDPLYRLIWGGVAIVRTDPNASDGEVRGDRNACVVRKGRLQPLYPSFRVQHPKSLCYKDDLGRTVRTTRLEFIPLGKMPWWEYEYIDYGMLYWFLERKISAKELVAIGLYSAKGSNVPSHGEYICILKLEKEGKYLEPDASWVSVVGSHIWEGTNMALSDLQREDREARDRAMAIQEVKDDIDARIEFDEAVDDLMLGKAKVDYFLPSPAGVRLLPQQAFDSKLREKVVNAISQETVPVD